jgi:hypothetical protein
MDADVTVARQLVDAYCDAFERGDSEAQDYADEQLADFVDQIDDATPDEVLVALLDLPLDAGSLALLNEVSAKLVRRGPGVVEALLGAALGDAPPELSLRDVVSVAGAVGALLEAATRNPNASPRTDNACTVLDAMPEGDVILGLVEVLEGPAGDRLKKAASEMLVDIGDAAVERLQMSLRDRDAEPWVTDTLVDIREGRDPALGDEAYTADQTEDDEAGARTDDAATAAYEDEDDEPDEAEDDEPDEGDESDDDVVVDEAEDDDPAADDAQSVDPAGADEPQAGDPAGTPGHLPSADAIGRGYDDFIARFKRETGQR